MDADVSLRGVTKTYGGRRVVDAVTLEVRRGEFFSLLGPSGCGKTTLLRLVAGFEEPEAGTILLAGADVARVPAHRRDVNMVFQSYALFPHLDVAGNVAFGIPKAPDAAARVREALARVNLAGFEARAVATLSGGEQQRVAFARAIVPGPRVLLLDEPLSALDLKLRKGLQEELRRLQRGLAMTFLYVTHDQEEALALSDRVGVMNGGALEQVGTPREIYDRPATRFVAGFVGAGNFFEAEGDGVRARSPEGVEAASEVRGRVTLMLRPEKMRLDGGPGLAARVEEVLYRGATTSVLLRAGERRLVVQDGGAEVRVGDAATVSWRPEDVRVLPA